jgi:hypothetical protein
MSTRRYASGPVICDMLTFFWCISYFSQYSRIHKKFAQVNSIVLVPFVSMKPHFHIWQFGSKALICMMCT